MRYSGRQNKPKPRDVRHTEITKKKLLWATSLGSSANMAFRRELFLAAGSFDVTLDLIHSDGNLWDAGGMHGSGAIEMLHRVVARGHTLMYEPAALVWSTHQRDLALLRSTLYENAKAFGAYLITCAHQRTVGWRSVLHFAVREWLGRWMWRRLCKPRRFSRRLIVAELAGALASPLAYAAAQKHARVQGQPDYGR